MTTFGQEFRAGWRNLLAAAIGIGLGIPAYTPVSSLFYRALEREFGWSKAAAAGAAIAMPIGAAVLPLAGLLIDRIGTRRVVALATLGGVACFLWLSRVGPGIGEYYAATVALNVCACATGPIGYTRLVATQFRAGRGRALALAQFGIAALAAVLPWVLSSVMDRSGWRGGYLTMAGAMAIGGVCAQMLMTGERSAIVVVVDAATPGPSIVRRPEFWVLAIAILAISIATLGLVSQFQSLMIERGFPAQFTLKLLSLLSVSVMASRLVMGWALDRWRPNRCAAAVYALAAIGAALLLIDLGALGTGAAVALIGLAVGAELDVLAYFSARLFGTLHYARNYGLLAPFLYVGIAAGGIGFGGLHDLTGSYRPAIISATALLMFSALLFLRLRVAEQPHA